MSKNNVGQVASLALASAAHSSTTRRIVDAVHSGELLDSEYETFGVFGLQIPTEVDGVPREVLNPLLAWTDKQAFEHEVRKLAGMFQKAFKLYEGDVQESTICAEAGGKKRILLTGSGKELPDELVKDVRMREGTCHGLGGIARLGSKTSLGK
ncbi:uncharacterized protein BJ212DRAFT_1400256 [Suillus subaureus]|uniref:Uncharacterized protein n=1 Tax=Suillus subaureus TaxID=48587 RepID=A0A9P7J2X4_9AGAM|nr:uncharacterized protein BJ212DRAFT_1400256 [Suillus subaureus]KAG1800572.1 hypothetical protein BJ212DRAFT_1400256 [Suillus subaureus]